MCHGGANILLLQHTYSTNFGDHPSHTTCLLPKPSPVTQADVGLNVIQSDTCLARTFYSCLCSLMFVLEAPSAKKLMRALLFRGGAIITWELAKPLFYQVSCFLYGHYGKQVILPTIFLIEAAWRIYASLKWPILFEITACRLAGAKPLFEPTLEYC